MHKWRQNTHSATAFLSSINCQPPCSRAFCFIHVVIRLNTPQTISAWAVGVSAVQFGHGKSWPLSGRCENYCIMKVVLCRKVMTMPQILCVVEVRVWLKLQVHDSLFFEKCIEKMSPSESKSKSCRNLTALTAFAASLRKISWMRVMMARREGGGGRNKWKPTYRELLHITAILSYTSFWLWLSPTPLSVRCWSTMPVFATVYCFAHPFARTFTAR